METRSRLPTVYRNYCRARNKVKNMIKYTRKQKEKCISGNIKKNDLPENVNSAVYMYADDTKIYREIKSEYDHGILQRDLENLKTW